MRHDLSKQCVTLGAVLLLIMACADARAQAPRQGGNARPPATPPPSGNYMPIQPAYTAPETPQGPFGLSSLPPSGVQQVIAQAPTPLPYGNPQPVFPNHNPPPTSPNAQAAQPAASPAGPIGGLRARFPNSMLFHNAPPNTAPPAATSPPATAALPPQQQPVPPAVGRGAPAAQAGVGGQLAGGPAAGLPPGPVVVYMPPGWIPPGGQVAFAPREVSPEVPAEHWPVPRRNPLGDADNGGIFRWPGIVRGESADDQPAPRRPAKALVSRDTRDEAETADARRPWQALIGTTSGGQDAQAPRARSKALFALRSKKTQAAPTAAMRAPVSGVAAAGPQREPRPATRPTPRQSTHDASRIRTELADAPESITDESNPNLKWHAKGAPRRQTRPSEPSLPQSRSGPRMASHTQPLEPTLARGDYDEEYPAEPFDAPPAEAAARPARAASHQRSLIPPSAMTARPVAQSAPLEESPVEWTVGPQQSTKALVHLVPPNPQRPQVPVPAPSSRGHAGGNQALLPNLFAKDSPADVGLATKTPAGRPGPMPAQTPQVHVVVVPYGSADMIDSYYAPPAQSAPAPSSRRLRGAQRSSGGSRESAERPAPEHAPQHDHHVRADAEQPATPRTYEPPKDMPALAKPLWAISEMTKLPKFITELSRGKSAPPPPHFDAYARRDASNRADESDHRQMIQRHIQPDEFVKQVDESDEELDVEVPPDVSAERRSKRRQKTGVAENGNTPERTAHDPLELADEETPIKRDPHEELDALYQSVVAERGESPDDPDAVAAPAPPANDADGLGKTDEVPPRRRENVPVVALERTEEPQPDGPNTTRIRKSDGTSVLVYHTREPKTAAQQSDAHAETVKKSKPHRTGQRQLTRPTDRDSKFRENPLR